MRQKEKRRHTVLSSRRMSESETEYSTHKFKFLALTWTIAGLLNVCILLPATSPVCMAANQDTRGQGRWTQLLFKCSSAAEYQMYFSNKNVSFCQAYAQVHKLFLVIWDIQGMGQILRERWWRVRLLQNLSLFSFVKDQVTVFVWVYFWTLCSVTLIYVSILSPSPWSLDYCIFRISLKVEYCESSNFVPLFWFILAILGISKPQNPFPIYEKQIIAF